MWVRKQATETPEKPEMTPAQLDAALTRINAKAS
jgi:hypothetical protein